MNTVKKFKITKKLKDVYASQPTFVKELLALALLIAFFMLANYFGPPIYRAGQEFGKHLYNNFF